MKRAITGALQRTPGMQWEEQQVFFFFFNPLIYFYLNNVKKNFPFYISCLDLTFFIRP